MVASDVLSLEEILDNLVTTVSCGGNMLLNVGPDSDGIIPPVFQQRLASLGQWLQVNGEAIYSSKPWRCQNDTLSPDVWYTSKAESLRLLAFYLTSSDSDMSDMSLLPCDIVTCDIVTCDIVTL